MKINKFGISELIGKRYDYAYLENSRKTKKIHFPTKELKELLICPPQYGANAPGIIRKTIGEPRYIRITDISEGGDLLSGLGVTLKDIQPQYKLNNDDMLLARSGNTVGKSYIHSTEEVPYECYFAGYMIRFIVNPKEILPQYFFIFTKTSLYCSWINAVQRRAGQPNINAQEYSGMQIPLPPLPTQQKIVDIYNKAKKEKQEKEKESQRLLDEIDTYLLAQLGIELPKEQQRELIYKVSISQLLGNKLDVRGNFNRKRNNSSLKYDEITLASIASIKKGQTITRESAKSGDYPVIAGGQTSPYFHQSYNELEGAITISASGAYAGFVWYHDYKFFASDCIIIRSLDEDRVLTSFLYEILKLKQTEIYLMQRGAGQPHVYSNDVAKIMIPNVPIVLQNKIVSYANGLRNHSEEFLREASIIMDQARRKIEQVILN